MKSTSEQIYGLYTREVRTRARKRLLAHLSVMSAGFLLGLGLGSLIANAASPLFSAIAINILIAGFFGGRYLLKHH